MTFAISILPIAGVLRRHILLALDVSQQDDWANRVWWNWFGSWIFCAGPLGRWFVGILLGVVKLRDSRPRLTYPGYLIEEPHIRVIVTATLAFLLSMFALVRDIAVLLFCPYTSYQALTYSSTVKVLKGITTLESIKASQEAKSNSNQRYFVCAPLSSLISDGTHITSVFAPLPKERIYDLGPTHNWRVFMERKLISTSIPRFVLFPCTDEMS